MSGQAEPQAAISWRSSEYKYIDMVERMASQQLDELQASLMYTEWEVRGLIEQLGNGNCRRMDPEHLCAVAVQLRSYQVRLYDFSTNLLESSTESTEGKKPVKRRRRRRRAYKK